MKDPAVIVLMRELDSVTQSISEISQNLRRAKQKKKSLVHALGVLGESLPSTKHSRNGEPSLADCTIRILQEKEALFVDEIVMHLLEGGRQVVKPSVVTALSRLQKKQGGPKEG